MSEYQLGNDPDAQGDLTVVFTNPDGSVTTLTGRVEKFKTNLEIDYEDYDLDFFSRKVAPRYEWHTGNFNFVQDKDGRAFTIKHEPPKSIHTATVQLPLGMDRDDAVAAAKKHVGAPDDAKIESRESITHTVVWLTWGSLE